MDLSQFHVHFENHNDHHDWCAYVIRSRTDQSKTRPVGWQGHVTSRAPYKLRVDRMMEWGQPQAAATREEALARLRLEAEQVRAELENVVSRFAAPLSGHSTEIHGLFAELYLCETVTWLDYLKRELRPELAYCVIPPFFALYREHVLDQLDQPLAEIATHWRPYHRLSRRLTMRSPIALHLLLISLGAWAHTRFDLGRAICETEIGPAREMDAMFGELSEVAFLQATRCYIDRHLARQSGWRRLVLRLYRSCLLLLKPIWLRQFQRWRKASHRDGGQAGPPVRFSKERDAA
jgi:hypothetical protein